MRSLKDEAGDEIGQVDSWVNAMKRGNYIVLISERATEHNLVSSSDRGQRRVGREEREENEKRGETDRRGKVET